MVTRQTEAKNPATTSERPRGFYPAADGLSHWTTDQLLEEILQRRANDAPALRRMQESILRALFAIV